MRVMPELSKPTKYFINKKQALSRRNIGRDNISNNGTAAPYVQKYTKVGGMLPFILMEATYLNSYVVSDYVHWYFSPYNRTIFLILNFIFVMVCDPSPTS